MRANACVRKKRNSTPELWRPCHLRSGYGDEPITRVKNPQASKRHRKHEKTLFLEWLLGRFRAKNGGSEKPAKRRTFPILAGTHTGVPGARLEILQWHVEPFEALFCLLTTCAIGSCRWAKQNLPNMSKCSVLGSMLVSMFRSIC